jgi:H+/Cl- antiporter ClcA
MDVLAMLRSRRYLLVLVVAGILGVPLSVAAYWFLVFASDLQRWVFMVLPSGFGYDTAPSWWSIPVLGVGGLLVAVTIRCLPGQGGESPADGFKAGHVTAPSAVPGIAIAALLTLGCGAVLGPEAPLIALGGGLALLAIRLTRAKVTPPAAAVLAGAGSFATISTLLGSPLLGAFLLMEASGVGGPALGTVLLPGLLAAGIGSLIFTGLDSWTGHGTFSLSVPDLPQFARPTIAEFGWAFVIGVAAAVVAVTIRWLALRVKPQVERRIFVLTPIAGMAVGVLALVYAEVSNRSASEVLFSGQTGLGPLIANGASYSVGSLLLLLACKSLAYSVSLGSFRGGPVFPALFLGAAGGIAMSHLPGLSLIPAVAAGIGAMSVSMLRLPLTSVLLATILLFSDGLAAMPLVIVAVVVAHLVSARLTPAPAAAAVAPAPAGTPDAADAPSGELH